MKIHEILVDGYKYEVVIIDSTHLKFKSEFSNNWATPMHVAQISDEMKKGLEEKGLYKNRFLVTASLKRSDVKAIAKILENKGMNALAEVIMADVRNFTKPADGSQLCEWCSKPIRKGTTEYLYIDKQDRDRTYCSNRCRNAGRVTGSEKVFQRKSDGKSLCHCCGNIISKGKNEYVVNKDNTEFCYCGLKCYNER